MPDRATTVLIHGAFEVGAVADDPIQEHDDGGEQQKHGDSSTDHAPIMAAQPSSISPPDELMQRS